MLLVGHSKLLVRLHEAGLGSCVSLHLSLFGGLFLLFDLLIKNHGISVWLQKIVVGPLLVLGSVCLVFLLLGCAIAIVFVAFLYRRGQGVMVDRVPGADLSEEALWLNGSVYAAIASLNGLTMGGGAEVQLNNRWSWKAEYRYTDYEDWDALDLGAVKLQNNIQSVRTTLAYHL